MQIMPRPRHLLIAMAALVCLGEAAGAHAAEWMFRRSYFSHEAVAEAVPGYPLPYSRSAYRPALTGTTPGFGGRGGFRYNNIVLGTGRTVDITVLHQGWGELQP